MGVSIWEGNKAQELIEAVNGFRGEVGLSNRAKYAILNIVKNVAFADSNGRQYINELSEAFFGGSVTSIRAVFTQGTAKIFDSDSLDALRPYLVVTANYSDGTTGILTDYELEGSLNSVVSTITVTYEELSDTFSVNVTMPVFDYKASRDGKLSEMSGILVDSNDLSKFSERVTSSGNLRLEGTENASSNYLQFKIGDNPSTGLWRMRIKVLIYSLSNMEYVGGLRPNISNGSSGLRFGMKSSNGAANIVYFTGTTENLVNTGLTVGEPETWYDFELFVDDSVPIQRLKIDGETIFESATFATAPKNNSVFIVGGCLIFVDTVKLYNA